jgi:hypothetical protein
MTLLTITNGVLDIQAQQGKTWRIHIALTDSLGAPVTPTDCKWQARASSADTVKVIDLSVGSGITLGTGTIDIVADATTTAALSAGKYVHEVEIHTSSIEVPPFLSGSLIVLPEVVR